MPRHPSMSDPLIAIPARLASTRLPDKPLADINGEPMIVQVWRRAIEAGVGPVIVATDRARDRRCGPRRRRACGDDQRRASDRLGPHLARRCDRHDPDGAPRHHRQPAGRLADDGPEGARSRRAAAVGSRRSTSRRSARRSSTRRRRPRRAWSSWSARRFVQRIACARSISRAPPRRRGPGPLYHHVGVYAYRRAALRAIRFAAADRRSRTARASSSCALRRTACASTRRSSITRRAASILPTNSSARARRSPASNRTRIRRTARDRIVTGKHRIPGRARRQFAHRMR